MMEAGDLFCCPPCVVYALYSVVAALCCFCMRASSWDCMVSGYCDDVHLHVTRACCTCMLQIESWLVVGLSVSCIVSCCLLDSWSVDACCRDGDSACCL